MARKYMNVDRFPYHSADAVRVIYKIEPYSIQTLG